MRTNICMWGLFSLLLLAGCNKNESEPETPPPPPPFPAGENRDIPEGYFIADFSPSASNLTKAAVSGPDSRVQYLRYIIYKNDGTYVKEKLVWQPASGTPSWPMASFHDTLPKGNYSAIFLANVEKTLFPYQANAGSPVSYSDVLLNYQVNLANAQIILPATAFSNTTEYYRANVGFSDQSPNPYILLQRIIGQLTVHRNVVDAQQALNQLVNNIVTNIGYKNIIRNQVQAILPDLLRGVLDKGNPLGNAIYSIVGGLNAAVNLLTTNLVEPVTTALYNILLQQLVNNLGQTLTGNPSATNQDLLNTLAVLLNPWEQPDAHTAIVTMKNFPKTTDFNLNVTGTFTGSHNFRCDLVTDPAYNQRCIYIKGFTGLFNIQNINVIKQGLISGLVFDDVVDGSLLLNGAFIDIADSLRYNDLPNVRYKADYAFLDLKLKSYTQQTDGPHNLTLSVSLGSIPGINDIFTGIPLLGPILNLAANGLLTPLKNIIVSVPINLPLLGVDNLSLSGGWQTPYAY